MQPAQQQERATDPNLSESSEAANGQDALNAPVMPALEEPQTHASLALDYPPPQPGSTLAALTGWLGVAAGTWGWWRGHELGWISADIAVFVAQAVGGLVSLVAGIVAAARKRPMHGTLLIIAGVILVAMPVLLVLAIASAYSTMSH